VGAGLTARAAPGQFQGSWQSLQAYQTPDWFRDAKFGIWAHWSAQCVPERGDWYARLMYMQGSDAYNYHVKTYGHPSRVGFMQIDHLWKADAWDPARLIELYRRAGAKYFVALANHHDNFDAYTSDHHPWNSVMVGPKRDIVGTWERLAREAGLRFGVSNHSAHAWHWFQTAYGYDAEGPLAGVRYDAAQLKRADGKGTWWEGLDPQALYTGPHMKVPDGFVKTADVERWHDEHDRQWLESPPPGDARFVRNWFLRCQDLIQKYRPDLVYFDDEGLPLGQTGLDITAWFYNQNRRWNDGRLEAVVTGKKLTAKQQGAIVEDVERGFSDQLRALPWQTDTCLGNWHYDRPLYERHGYKSAYSVIARLCDVVAKNGNLLLSVPMRGNGSIDEDEVAILEELARWMAVNGEAIFATRPWRQYGEGPTRLQSGAGESLDFTSQDIRFTRRGETLYALALKWPEADRLSIRALANTAGGNVQRVELLGQGPLKFARDSSALQVELPHNPVGKHVYTFKISGDALV
jgi:alpha-L-fucosidase